MPAPRTNRGGKNERSHSEIEEAPRPAHKAPSLKEERDHGGEKKFEQPNPPLNLRGQKANPRTQRSKPRDARYKKQKSPKRTQKLNLSARKTNPAGAKRERHPTRLAGLPRKDHKAVRIASTRDPIRPRPLRPLREALKGTHSEGQNRKEPNDRNRGTHHTKNINHRNEPRNRS